jgi:hypothetical protein
MEKKTIASMLDIFYVDELREICRAYDLQAVGNKVELIELIIHNVTPVSKIIEDLRVEELKTICSSLDLKPGSKAQMQKELFEILDLERTGLIKDEVPKEKLEPTADNVISKLKELIIDKRRIKSEKDAEEEIGDHLSMYFRDVMSQYNLPGYLGLKIDLDINDGKFGIEVKLVDSFLKSTSELFRVFGQAVYYTKKRYGENFIVAVVGTPSDLEEPVVREAMSFLNSINIKWIGIIMR